MSPYSVSSVAITRFKGGKKLLKNTYLATFIKVVSKSETTYLSDCNNKSFLLLEIVVLIIINLVYLG